MIVFSRVREQAQVLQTIRSLPTYHEIPASIRDYLEYNNKPAFDPLRTLTPTSNLSSQPATTSPHSHIFGRMNSGPPGVSNVQQAAPPVQTQYSAVKDNQAQKGVRGLTESHSDSMLMSVLAFVDPKCEYSNVDQ